jgi:hypothetical protein
MKNAIANSLFHQHPSAASQKKAGGLLALTALLLCGLALPASAETTINQVAHEQGFTIAPGVSTPIVLKTTADAACDLHGETASDRALRFDANLEGYVKIHVRPEQGTEDTRLQLDCTDASGAVTRYPLHLNISSSPTKAMPAPLSMMPAPKGSYVRPALTDEQTQQFSNTDLNRLGYPERPDANESPEQYAAWLKEVSRSFTILPQHKVSRTDIHYNRYETQDTLDNYNWSGFVSDAKKRTYDAVEGSWNVPEIFWCETNYNTYSDIWVGLDGYNLTDLVQAGSQQDCFHEDGTYISSYSTWTELLPNEPWSEDTGLYPNPGDSLSVEVWISTAAGTPNANGSYGAFWVADETLGVATLIYTPLNGTYFNGSEAEWIFERPGLSGGTLAQLSDYERGSIIGAWALTTAGKWTDYSKTSNLLQLNMYNEYMSGDDNNLLSSTEKDGATTISFQWHNYH